MKIKLFCIPYAGGSATVYHKYKRFLSNDVILRPVELAGRGGRLREDLYPNLETCINDVYTNIKDELDDMPFMFFGHSLGALITYKTVLKIEEERGLKPLHLFLSASRPPHLLINGKVIHNLPDDEFINEILDMGGTDRKVFEDDELSRYFIRLLKGDFKIIEEYEYKGDEKKLDIPLTVFSGTRDKIASTEIAEWQQYTEKTCELYSFEGDHFFINSDAEEVGKVINRTINRETALLKKAQVQF